MKYYAVAEKLWYRNSRLPRKEAASLLYNEACALLLVKADKKYAVIRLLEAMTLSADLVEEMVSDKDLAELRISEQPAPKPSTIAILLESKNASAPAVQDTAKQQGIDDEQLLRFLAYLVAQRRR